MKKESIRQGGPQTARTKRSNSIRRQEKVGEEKKRVSRDDYFRKGTCG